MRNQKDCTVEIAVSGEDFAEVALHADHWILSLVFLSEPSISAVYLNLVASYIYDRLRTLGPGRTAEVESEGEIGF